MLDIKTALIILVIFTVGYIVGHFVGRDKDY